MVARSVVLSGNDKARIDSRYFGSTAVALDARIRSLPHEPLGVLCESFRKGIFDIKADSYIDKGGVPFVRVGDLRSGLIDFDTVARITTDAHLQERKTALGRGDIVLSKTAYAAAALVTVDQCNASQDTIAAHFSSGGRDRFRPGFVVSYLNSRLGRTLVAREFQGNVQEHLGLGDAAALPIPLFNQTLHDLIHDLVIAAEYARESAKAALAEAESLLLDALGLRDWSPPEPLTYTRSAADIGKAGRLDSEFAAPKVQALLARLSADGQAITDIASVRRQKFQPANEGHFKYIEIGDVDGFGRCSSNAIEMAEAPSRATWHVRTGDVISSTVRPIRRLSAIVSDRQDQDVCSSGFVVLEPTGISSECLLTYLRLPLVCELMHLFATASMYPALPERDMLALPIPVIDPVSGKLIDAAVRESREALAHSEALLTAAKRAVEIAIEDSEAAALVYIAEQEATHAPLP